MRGGRESKWWEGWRDDFRDKERKRQRGEKRGKVYFYIYICMDRYICPCNVFFLIFYPIFFFANVSGIYLCMYVRVHVRAVPPIAVDYPGDTEQSLQQPSAVNEQMESTAFPLNSLSLYWTWWCRLIIGLSRRYFGWLIPVLIKKRRQGGGVCWQGWLKCAHQQQQPTGSQWLVGGRDWSEQWWESHCRPA